MNTHVKGGPGEGWHYATLTGPIELVYVNSDRKVLTAGSGTMRAVHEFRFFGPVPTLMLSLEERKVPFDYSRLGAIMPTLEWSEKPGDKIDLDKVLAVTKPFFDPDPMIQQVSDELARMHERSIAEKEAEAAELKERLVKELTDKVVTHFRTYVEPMMIDRMTSAVVERIMGRMKRSFGA